MRHITENGDVDYYTPHPESEVITETCKLCGKPLRLVVPGDGELFSRSFRNIAKMVVHNECIAQLNAQRKANDIMEHEEFRKTAWEKLCPKEFQKEIEWNKKRRARYDSVLQWQFSPSGIVLIGASGQCKTRFSWCLLKREYDGGRGVNGITHTDFRAKITALTSGDMEAAKRFVDSLINVDLLLFDDLGKGRRTPASEEALFLLIDGRAMRNHPTIYTLNTPLEVFAAQLSEEYREPLIRRITEHTTQIKF